MLAQPAGAAPLLHAEVEVPRALLAGGLVLIDTPALPGLPETGASAVADLRTLAMYARADLVLFACEATREITDAELDVLADLARLYPHVLVALTKTDVARRWRDTLAATRDRLRGAGVPATLIAVSSTLAPARGGVRQRAAQRRVGIPAPHRRTCSTRPRPSRTSWPGPPFRCSAGSPSSASPLRCGPTCGAAAEPSDAVAQLHDAQRRLEDLRRITTRWQNCLTDEAGDLMSDIEQDLRERTRAVLAEAEQNLDTIDPARGWDDFEKWLRQAVQDAAEESFAWLADRAEWVAFRVCEQFPEYGDQVTAALAARHGQRRAGSHDQPQRAADRALHRRRRSSSPACAARTAASSWSVWPPAWPECR